MRSLRPRYSRWHKALYGATAGLTVMVVAVPLTGAVADAIDPPSAIVSGTVFEDRDNDDRVDQDERVLAGVSVSDGQRTVVTDAAGRYTFDTAVERRDTDLVFITQPAGWSVSTDEFMTPLFYRDLGQLTEGEAQEVNFGLRRDRDSERGGFSFGNIADPHVNAQLS